jgi:hypothetical protein
MQILLAHYIVHGNIGPDGANLSSARTLLGLKLRTDTRSDSVRVNGAAISKEPLFRLLGTPKEKGKRRVVYAE